MKKLDTEERKRREKERNRLYHINNPNVARDKSRKWRTVESNRQKERDKANSVSKEMKLRHTHGMTLEQYNLMFESQNGCCKICGTPQISLKLSLAVDHCHKTGKKRGLLCGSCNVALGQFKDNIKTLESAIEYLKLHQ